MPGNWVVRVAAEERRRDQTRSREAAVALHHFDVVRFRLECLMVTLKDRVSRDVEAFVRELRDRRPAFVVSMRDDGFTVQRESYPEGHLTVTSNLHDGVIRVQYLFASENGIAAPKLVELMLDRENGFAVHVRDSPTQRFESVEQLSEFLLVPLFRGPVH